MTLHAILIFHTILQDCAQDCLSQRLKKEGKKTGVLGAVLQTENLLVVLV